MTFVLFVSPVALVGFQRFDEVLVLGALVTDDARLLTTLFEIRHKRVRQPTIGPRNNFQTIDRVVVKRQTSRGDHFTTRGFRDRV